ncbi:MAG: alpha-glucan family phosphorylase, partial [Candidatus Omnitrophica bacterium]|nr:alpha-glucan family phosphorylase [Candidatus Omnitrophota bacterium]
TVELETLPIELQVDAKGRPILVEVNFGKHPVVIQIWKIKVGRVALYLLDTNLSANQADDREITAQLYGGDTDLRIRQEIVLGIGGYRAIRKLGINPSVCHMNEGHAAFLTLERIREAMHDHRLTFEEAKVATAAGNVFTTHTPVPAGNDRFAPERIEHYLAEEAYKDLGLTAERFLALGRENEQDPAEWFCMTVLALKLSSHSNGVSKLHGDVSRNLWKRIWPETPHSEVPINSITNGIHIRTWLSGDMASLFDRYLGVRWWSNPVDTAVWERVEQIPDAELWRTHQRRTDRLVSFIRKRLKKQLTRRGLPTSEVNLADEVLDPDSLTIGFARRFASYKRGTLLFRNPERLAKILNNPARPVQIVYAGKAHPADNPGKEIIRQLAHFCRQPEFRHNVVFIEDYDMNVARYMLQGVDIWLNTPRRPLEASGTSGMKAAANAVLNLSILDGWWCEAYQGDNGWAIGSGEDYSDPNYQDQIESETLYEMLEKDIVPLFYERGRDDLPRGWIKRMKRCLITICPVFNTNRMLREYSERFYFPAAEHSLRLVADDFAAARQAAQWEARVLAAWKSVEITQVRCDVENQVVRVGQKAPIQIEVSLKDLDPSDIAVEVYYGRLNSDGELVDGRPKRLEFQRKTSKGDAVFGGEIPCHTSGRFGFSARVILAHPDIPAVDRLRSIKWA